MVFKKGKYLSHVDIIVENSSAAKGFFGNMFDWTIPINEANDYRIVDTKSILGREDQAFGIWKTDQNLTVKGAVPFYWDEDVDAFIAEIGQKSEADVEVDYNSYDRMHPRGSRKFCIIKYHNDTTPGEEVLIGVIQE